MDLRMHTMDGWDEAWWRKAEPIYERAFPRQGRKTERVIRHVVERRLGCLHVAMAGAEPVAMALTGKLEQTKGLLIDYLAVSETRRREGIGAAVVDMFKQLAAQQWGLDYILIEIEAEDTPESRSRLHFWQRCGFRLTDYVHRYIWVPEPYRAMYCPLRPDARVSADGEVLFRAITQFHKLAYRG